MSSPNLAGASLPYHEPTIVTILIYASFVLLLNAVNFILDRLVYCGLIGQILVGVAWGVPGAKWLDANVQTTAVNLGYLGLILIVFEGGLATDLRTLKANLGLSVVVALVGISAPIGLSFALQGFLPGVTPVQAFVAGAALCSTSLGTTFTVLTTSGLTESRLGVVLTSAAMIDDVVGLVMVQVIGSLGSSDFGAATVVRPVGVSVAFAVVVPLACRFIVQPLAEVALSSKEKREREDKSWIWTVLETSQAAWAFHTAILLAFVTGSSYAGTSNLFAAYLAGACISWFDEFRPSTQQKQKPPPVHLVDHGEQAGTPEPSREETLHTAQNHNPEASNHALTTSIEVSTPAKPSAWTGHKTYMHYYSPTVTTILKPLFFASIGFSIPITRMFTGTIIWRGFVYAALMTAGKLLCGACLLRLSLPSLGIRLTHEKVSSLAGMMRQRGWGWKKKEQKEKGQGEEKTEASRGGKARAGQALRTVPDKRRAGREVLKSPLSVYPAAILGSAMVSRGEIGFLISSVAESNGVFSSGGDGEGGTDGSELFLVVTWAILLCTILGPISVGLMVKRVKRLQVLERERKTGKMDPLGIWGVAPDTFGRHRSCDNSTSPVACA